MVQGERRMKQEVTADNLEHALWFPEDYHWGPSTVEERPTQGGGTVVWDIQQNCYVFKTTPEWWKDCKPGDPMPDEWDVL
jgi:hypothetical protein